MTGIELCHKMTGSTLNYIHMLLESESFPWDEEEEKTQNQWVEGFH